MEFQKTSAAPKKIKVKTEKAKQKLTPTPI